MILKTATLPLVPAMRVAREKSRLSTERMVTVGKRQIAVKSLHGIQRSLIGFILRHHLYGALSVRLPCVHILVKLRQMPLRGTRLFCHYHAAAHCQDDCKQRNAPHTKAPARLNATVCRGWKQKRHGAYAETIRVPSLIQGCTHQPQNTMKSAAFRHSRPPNGRIIRTRMKRNRPTCRRKAPSPVCRSCVAPNASASSVERNYGFVTWLT